jgi:hypothetical protein
MSLLAAPPGDTKLVTRFVPCQFSDTPEQKRSDVKKIFKKFKDADIICGTESGEEPIRSLLRFFGKKAGFRVHLMRAHWIAVK